MYAPHRHYILANIFIALASQTAIMSTSVLLVAVLVLVPVLSEEEMANFIVLRVILNYCTCSLFLKGKTAFFFLSLKIL